MAYRLSFDGPTLVIVLSGRLVPADLDSLGRDLLALERDGANVPHRLVDLRQVTEPLVGYAEMAKLAERLRTRALVNPVRSAIVVAQPVQLGFARMFQTLNDHPWVTVRIFEDEGEARAWLLANNAVGGASGSAGS